MNEERSAFHASIHESVFQSSAPSPALTEQPLCWEQHAKLLPGVAEVCHTLVSSWSVDEVAEFVLKLTGNKEQAQKFKEEVNHHERIISNRDCVFLLSVCDFVKHLFLGANRPSPCQLYTLP